MRKLILAAALVSALALGACQTVHNIDTAVALANENVGDFTVMDEKAWYYAEALYNVPAQAYLSVNAHGLFAGHADLKATIKADLQKLNGLRNDVYTAYKAGNAVTFHDKLAQLKVLSDEVRRLIPAATAQAAPVRIPAARLQSLVAAS